MIESLDDLQKLQIDRQENRYVSKCNIKSITRLQG